MNYLFFALTAATCFAISQVMSKLLSKHSIDNRDSLMAYFMMSSFVFGLLLLPFTPMTIPSIGIIKIIAVATVTFLLGYYAFYTGITEADASTIAPLFQMQAALVGLFAFLFLGERFPLQNYLWMMLLIVGAVLVSMDDKMSIKSFFNKGIALILLMQIFHAISSLFIGFALKELAPIQILFWEDMAIGVAGLVFILIKRPRLDYKLNQISPMFLSIFIVGVGIISLFKAFAENLTISSILGLLSAPMVFMISLAASRLSPELLEHHPAQVYLIRGAGLLVILLAAFKIALG